MNSVIETLHQSVTPEVLAATTSYEGSEASKKQALTSLYQVGLLSISDNTTYGRVQGLSDTNDGDVLFGSFVNNDTATKNAVYDAIAKDSGLPVATVSALAAAALPRVYQHVKGVAGTQDIPAHLADKRTGFIGTIPAWLAAVLPAGLLAAAAPVATPVTETTGTLTKEEKQEGSFGKALLPIIGAIIFAGLAWMLLKACQKDPAPVAAPVASVVNQATDVVTPATLSPATLALALDGQGNAIYACESDVGNAELGGQISGAVGGTLDAGICHFNISTAVANDMPALPYVPQILSFMTGVPDASVSIVDKTILLNASDAAAVEKLVADVTAAVPSDFTVMAEPQLNEAETIAQSIADSATALESAVSIDDLVRALNLQIINFALDSTEIPDENKAILDRAAARLKELPEAHIQIIGHTDNQGSMSYNKDLSERRAQAVHDYLVAQGVNDDKLDTEGASYTRPVATNATEQGRFRNRRIEFVISNNGETVANIDRAAALGDGATADTVADDIAIVTTDDAVIINTTTTSQ